MDAKDVAKGFGWVADKFCKGVGSGAGGVVGGPFGAAVGGAIGATLGKGVGKVAEFMADDKTRAQIARFAAGLFMNDDYESEIELVVENTAKSEVLGKNISSLLDIEISNIEKKREYQFIRGKIRMFANDSEHFSINYDLFFLDNCRNEKTVSYFSENSYTIKWLPINTAKILLEEHIIEVTFYNSNLPQGGDDYGGNPDKHSRYGDKFVK